jgi:uncharacterized protein
MQLEKEERLNLSENEYIVVSRLKSTLRDLLGDRLIKFVLFGSKARGDDDPESDIDIGIIVNNLTRKLKLELLSIVADIELEYLKPMSTIFFDEQEFNNLLKRERRIALDILNEGIVL